MITHGMRNTKVYEVWCAIKYRCKSKRKEHVKYYLDRGIKVCKKWQKFEGFWQDMKDTYKDGLTIDRIDNNKGYNKKNCRWATVCEQSVNKRRTIFLVYKGKREPMVYLARKLGIKYQTALQRYRKGWTVDRVLKV